MAEQRYHLMTLPFLIVLEVTNYAQGRTYSCAICICFPGKIHCQNLNMTSIPLDTIYEAYYRNTATQPPVITEFDASHNEITTLPADTFKVTPFLKVLRLQYNNLSWIGDGLFDVLRQLEELNLAHNSLVSLHVNIFSHLSSMRYLYLHSNNLQILPYGIFENLLKMQYLDISHNPLRDALSLNITFPPNIQVLHVKNVGLQELAQTLFIKSTDIRILDIAENKLSSIPFETLEKINNLKAIDLSGNLWMCDCELLPLKMWLAYRNVSVNNGSHAICSFPLSLVGHQVQEVEYDDFTCTVEIMFCKGCFYPTPTPPCEDEEFKYWTCISILASFSGMIVVFVICLFFYSRSLKRWAENQLASGRLARIRSSAKNLLAFRSFPTVTFLLGLGLKEPEGARDKDKVASIECDETELENEKSNTVTFMLGEQEPEEHEPNVSFTLGDKKLELDRPKASALSDKKPKPEQPSVSFELGERKTNVERRRVSLQLNERKPKGEQPSVSFELSERKPKIEQRRISLQLNERKPRVEQPSTSLQASELNPMEGQRRVSLDFGEWTPMLGQSSASFDSTERKQDVEEPGESIEMKERKPEVDPKHTFVLREWKAKGSLTNTVSFESWDWDPDSDDSK